MAVLGVHRHPNQGRIVREIQRPRLEVIAVFRDCYSAFALDYLGKLGAMSLDLLPLSPGMKMCGPAVTSLGPDLSVRRMAIDLAMPGDVLVVAAGGATNFACFGDGTARRMMLKQISGVVIDGSTRDAAGIRALNFPTFVRGITPRNYHYPVSGEYGAVNVPVVCAGVLITPGDIILGDDDGVVVIPQDAAEELSRKISTTLSQETIERENMTQYEPFNLEEELRQRGYRFE
jgi:4-hydroxy-4-methyl-2-oxoglutarate aldolase